MRHPKASSLIGFNAKIPTYESFYIYVSRIISANFLNEKEVHQYISSSWLQLAFAPHNAREAQVDAIANEAPAFLSLKSSQAMTASWEIFPTLESHPNEFMRFCPKCLMDGHHSYAFQSTLIKECPIHCVALTDTCSDCGTPVPWKSHLVYSKSALRCPRGCDLSGQQLNGLKGTPRRLEDALARHFEWTQQLKKNIQFELGPIYIAYPPRQQLEGITPYRPSFGLTATLCEAFRLHNHNIPEFLSFHDTSHGGWQFKFEGWDIPDTTEPLCLERRSLMARAIDRGPYVTLLPMPTSPHGRIALNQLASTQIKHKFRRLYKRDRWLIAVPSHLVTNSEVTALYQVLCSEQNDAAASIFYDRLLVELLERAYERRTAFDSAKNATCLDIAERIEGLVSVGGRSFRFTATTKSDLFGREAWETYSEQTAPRSGTIVFATARGIGN